jgi:hypothetical protein
VDSLLNNICVWSLPQSYLDFIVSCVGFLVNDVPAPSLYHL